MPHLTTYLGLADHSEEILAASFRLVADGHASQVDVFHTCHMLAGWCDDHREALAPVAAPYGEGPVPDEPDRLRAAALEGVRDGGIGLLRDLQDLFLLATLVRSTWTVVAQGAQGVRNRDLLSVATTAGAGTDRQLAWLTTRIKAAAPQALVVGP